MAPSKLDQVRTACEAVVEQASHVHIDQGRIRPYAASLPLELAEPPALDPRHHFFGSPDDTLAYTVTLDAINFGSGYFPHLRKRPGMSGYFTVASSLKDEFKRRGPLSAAR